MILLKIHAFQNCYRDRALRAQVYAVNPLLLYDTRGGLICSVDDAVHRGKGYKDIDVDDAKSEDDGNSTSDVTG